MVTVILSFILTFSTTGGTPLLSVAVHSQDQIVFLRTPAGGCEPKHEGRVDWRMVNERFPLRPGTHMRSEATDCGRS